MKALRDWMKKLEALRLQFDGRVTVRNTKKLFKLILAMADVMEAVAEIRRAEDTMGVANMTPLDWDRLYDNLYKAEAAAQSVIKEVTHGTNT